MTALSQPHLTYRPDVDGLRALAVGLVIGYHYFPNHVPAGFIGVDVFFVISGFLITSIVLGDAAEGRFSLQRFYTRRVNRIFPALALVLLANLALGWYAMVVDEFQALGKHVAASAAFVSNFALWNEAGYFDNAAEIKPLLHFWSLAIEEQFYIVWPLLIATLWRRRWVAWLMLAATLASFAFNLWEAGRDATAAYYSPLTRGWQLAVGGLLAYASLRGSSARWAASQWRAAGGLLLLGIAVLVLDKTHAYPSGWALLPTLGTALLISAGPATVVNRRLLSLRPMVWVGLISYPLYLWHWPVLVWAKLIAMTSNLAGSWRLGLIALSVALAWLTFVGVERRVRRHNTGRTACLLAAVVFCAGASGLAIWGGVVTSRMNGDDLGKVVTATKDWDYPPASFKQHVRFADYRFYRKQGSGPGTTLFVGDSNMEQYAPRVEYVLDHTEGSPSAIFATKGGCTFAVPYLAQRMNDCKGKLATVDELIASEEVTAVVFAQAWHNLAALLDDPAAVASLDARFASVPAGKRVFVILNIPSGMEFSPVSLISGSRLGQLEFKADAGQVVSEALAREKYSRLHQVVAQVAARHGVVVIDPFETMCNAGMCALVSPQGVPLYKDTAHLTASFARGAATFVDVTLRPAKR